MKTWNGDIVWAKSPCRKDEYELCNVQRYDSKRNTIYAIPITEDGKTKPTDWTKNIVDQGSFYTYNYYKNSYTIGIYNKIVREQQLEKLFE